MEIKPLGLFIVAFIVITIGLITVQQAAQNVESIDIESLSSSQTILAASSDTLTQLGLGITSSEVKAYNNTWLNCSVDDSLTVTITENKTTVSIWFANETTDWTSIINSNDTIYIDGSLDAGWTFLPYFISGDIVTFCKTDGSTFLDISIDAIRVYEKELNSTEVLEVYDYGR